MYFCKLSILILARPSALATAAADDAVEAILTIHPGKLQGLWWDQREETQCSTMRHNKNVNNIVCMPTARHYWKWI